MPSYPSRVAAKANEVRPARVILSILAFPFYLLGLLAGLVIVLFAWAWAAVVIGVADVKFRSRNEGVDAG